MAESFESLASYLTSLGLADLFTIDANGNPGGFLYDQMVNGVETPGELQIALESNDLFKKRYKIILS